MKMMCLFLGMVVCCILGCSCEKKVDSGGKDRVVRFGQWDLDSIDSTNGLIRFFDETLMRYGYADRKGNVILEPRYGTCSVTFFDGYAWVELIDDENDPTNDYYDCSSGDFIDTNGVRLVGKKLYCTTPQPWMWGYHFEPQFVNGHALVSADPADFPGIIIPTNANAKIKAELEKKSARYVYCIDTNGIPTSAHQIHGPFYTTATSSNGPNFRDKRPFLWVDLLNGDRGILLSDGTIALTTSVNDYEKLHQIERQFINDHFGTNGVEEFSGQAWRSFD